MSTPVRTIPPSPPYEFLPNMRAHISFILITTSLLQCLLGAQDSAPFTVAEALKRFDAEKLVMPDKEADGRIQTLNKKGAMSPALDQATLSFIEFGKNKKVLEIGGAYGFVMGTMLAQHPDTIYHINDIDERHLYIAAHNLTTLNIPQKTLDAVQCITGDMCKLETTERYDAILIARVLHFMNPEQLNAAINTLSTLLTAGGRVYVVAISPYVKRYERFIPEYEARLTENRPYPGYVSSLRDWYSTEVTSVAQSAAISDEPFMFLDDTVLTKLFTEAGFTIMTCTLTPLSYSSPAWTLDGRENVILIAAKK